MPSMSVSCVAMSAETTSVGPTMPLVVENCSCMWLVRNSSSFSSSMLEMSPTVTMANVPSLEHMTSGCGSVSEMTPMPTAPAKREKSLSNFDRNGAFWMLWIERWKTPSGLRTAMPPRCVPR